MLLSSISKHLISDVIPLAASPWPKQINYYLEMGSLE